jgi:Tol biopolymer transport system component
LTIALLAGCVLTAGARAADRSASSADEAALLGRVRQLTFAGRRAGEGYFSQDGRRLVFQSERDPANPFFQIYELDLETGETRRISPGLGKTTCAYVRPGRGDVLFASTHHDPESAELQEAELAFRASGAERRYDWDFDPEMELWVEDHATRALHRLTDSPGYDAEGSYSPDGERIVFTSTRSAWAEPLDAAGRARLDTDPAHYAEIYVMPASGGAAVRLTTTPGYDGGPFFMPDGERIVWRRFVPDSALADVWTMRVDGSDVRQITDFGAMSWAPYPHPSGEYLFFTSNKHGMDNFELFIVDAQGTKEPLRVTFTPGFDGLPVPSPDGRRLTWTSTRHGGSGGQIFIADWQHERARAALAAAAPRQASVSAASEPGRAAR